MYQASASSVKQFTLVIKVLGFFEISFQEEFAFKNFENARALQQSKLKFPDFFEIRPGMAHIVGPHDFSTLGLLRSYLANASRCLWAANRYLG